MEGNEIFTNLQKQHRMDNFNTMIGHIVYTGSVVFGLLVEEHNIYVCVCVCVCSCTCMYMCMQVNGKSMVGITHEEAVQILTSVDTTASLRVEKNAIGTSSQLTSTDDEEDEDVRLVA